jgi:hypothetical protein
VVRLILLASALALLAGCPIDTFNRYDRPARTELGFNMHHYAASPSTVATREVSPEMETTTDGTAATVAFRFTMKTRWNTYTGAEAEAGTFSHAGSNFAGAYAVFGASAPLSLRGNISAELAGGWRATRESVDARDRSVGILEPRVRGELWLSPQVTLGGVMGAELSPEHPWMAGLYLGIHSHSFNARTPNR